MQPEPRDAALLLDMLTYARAVQRITAGLDVTRYLADETSRLAVERAVEIVGEAARHVSRTFQDAHPTIPWRKIAAQRHVLAHDYGEIDHVTIWRVATVHVPELIAQLERLLPPPPSAGATAAD